MSDHKTPYQGWANANTWNVALWMDNDEGLYEDYCRRFRRQYDIVMSKPGNAEVKRRLLITRCALALRRLAIETWDYKTPDGYTFRQYCNFREIAEAFLIDLGLIDSETSDKPFERGGGE